MAFLDAKKWAKNYEFLILRFSQHKFNLSKGE